MEALSNHFYLSYIFLKYLSVNYLAGTEFCNRSLMVPRIDKIVLKANKTCCLNLPFF